MEKLNAEKAKTLKKKINLIVGIAGATSMIVGIILLVAPAIFLVAPNCWLANIYTISALKSFTSFMVVMASAMFLSLFTIPNMLNEVK